MRILIQIVKDCSVEINGQVFSKIKDGFCLFVGFTQKDNESIIDKMINKLISLRIFPDSEGKTNLNIKQINGEIMSISQFTLYADVRKGNRPSFDKCLSYDDAEKLYSLFNKKLTETGISIKSGSFGADMNINLTNKGPFTIMIDSDNI